MGMSAFFPSEPALAARRDIALRAMTEKLEHGETDAGLEIFIDYVNGPGAWKSTAEGTKNWLRANAWTLAAEGKDTATWAPFSCEDAKGLNVPVLLLGGEKSPKHFGATLDRIQACLPRSTRGVIGNSSHSMPRMNPQGFNSEVLTFIATH